jgi:hypothetical protein
MIRRQNMLTVGESVFRSVLEDESLAAGDFPSPQKVCHVSIETNFPQTNDHAQITQQRDFLI